MLLYATKERQRSQLIEQASLKIEIEIMQAQTHLWSVKSCFSGKSGTFARPSFKDTASRVI